MMAALHDAANDAARAEGQDPDTTVDLQNLQSSNASSHHLADLFAKARELTELSVAAAVRDERAAAEAMAKRLRAESNKLLDALLAKVPTAILDAAASGKRVATLLEFSGGDVFEEFCYLYMVKGPHTLEGRAEMKRAGVTPIMDVLRRTLHPAGFTVWHAWQRATNHNTITVSW